jgi:hypothetical protein
VLEGVDQAPPPHHGQELSSYVHLITMVRERGVDLDPKRLRLERRYAR